MTDLINSDCIRVQENHDGRIGRCEADINKMGSTMRSEVQQIWDGIDKQRKNISNLGLFIIGSVLFQTVALIITIYVKR